MIVRVSGLRVRGFHGVLESERREGQTFVVDVVLDADVAPQRDDLAETVDYAVLSERLAAIVAGEPVDLIETLAQRLSDACLDDERVRRVEVTVHKPEVPLAVTVDEVSVTLVVTRAVLSLGANLGDPAEALRHAVQALAARVTVVAVSPVYETEPVGGVPQDDFLNAVVVVETDLAPRDLLTFAHQIEYEAGRVRDVRWGPRSLDVDLIAYGDLASPDPDVTVPHPRAHERAFVLVPWAALEPGAVLPGRGRVADLMAALPADDLLAVTRWDHLR